MSRLRLLAVGIQLGMPWAAVVLTVLAVLAALILPPIYEERQADRIQAANLAKKGLRK